MMTRIGCLLLTCLWIVTPAFAFEKELKGLAAVLANNVSKAGKKSVAVVDFCDLQGNVTDGGRFLAEEFTVDLAAPDNGLKVIERTRLAAIIQEHKLASTGIIDVATAKKLGELAGIDAIITGVVTPLGDAARISVKALSADTAEVIGATSGDIPIERTVQALFAQRTFTTSSAQPKATPTPSVASPPIVTPPEPPPKNQPSAALIAPPRPPQKDLPPPQLVDGYTVAVTRCGVEEDQLVCELTATNTKAESRTLFITRQRTRAFDAADREYRSDPEILGNHVAGHHMGGFSVSSIMPPGVGVRIKLRFSPYLAKTGKIAVLNVIFTDKDGKDSLVQFRNIPVAPETPGS